MLKRTIAVVVACALLLQVAGCTAVSLIPLDETNKTIWGEIDITMVDGTKINHSWAYSSVRRDTLFIIDGGKAENIPLSSIGSISARRFHLLRSLALSGVVVFVYLGIAGLFQPIYSPDGGPSS